jgi:hypothetical protein
MMKVRVTMLMLVAAAGAGAGIVAGGPRSVIAPVAASTGRAQSPGHQSERATSRPTTIATQPGSSPCTQCTAIRLKLGALTLLAGFALLVGGFALFGRRTGSKRGKAEVADTRDG